MKNLLTLILAAGMSLVFGQDMLVNFQPESTSWDKVREMAASENKFIFVDAYTEWCGWCKVQDKKTFTDEEVATFINENFVSIKYDFERGTGRLLAMKHRVKGYPTILFFSPEGKLVGRHVGYEADKGKFMEICANAMQPENFVPVVGDPDKLDVEFPEFYKSAFGPNGERTYPKPEVVAEWLSGQKDLYTEVSYNVLMNMPLDKEWTDYLMSRSESYADRFGRAEIQDKVYGLISRKAYGAAREGDKEAFEEAMGEVDMYVADEDRRDFKMSMQRLYHEQQEEWVEFTQIVNRQAEAEDYSNHGMLNSAAWTLYTRCETTECLNAALDWMTRVVTAEPDNYMYLDTHAALLYKVGRYDDAMKYADIAIAAGKATGEDVSETEDLRKKIKKAKAGQR